MIYFPKFIEERSQTCRCGRDATHTPTHIYGYSSKEVKHFMDFYGTMLCLFKVLYREGRTPLGIKATSQGLSSARGCVRLNRDPYTNSNSKIVFDFIFRVLIIHTFIFAITIPYIHTYIIDTCQAASNLSGSPIESQWGILKYPGQLDRYDHGHTQGYKRVNTLHTHNSHAGTIELLACINSLRPGDAYVHLWAGSPLIKKMTCCPFGTKPPHLPRQTFLEYINRKKNQFWYDWQCFFFRK